MRYIIVSIICLAILSGIVSADSKVFNILLDINKNDSVRLMDFSIIDGKENYLPSGDFSLQIMDNKDNLLKEIRFNVNFIIFTDPPQRLEHVPVNIRTFYMENADKIKLLHSKKILFEGVISEFSCNNDSVCNNYENFISCPKDCPSGSKDRYCDKVFDKICDPDCARDVDVDCLCGDNKCEVAREESYKTCPEDCFSGSLDGYCDGVSDGKCDPDCLVTEDPDCKHVVVPETASEKRDNNLWFIIITIVLILIIVVFLIFKKSKSFKK